MSACLNKPVAASRNSAPWSSSPPEVFDHRRCDPLFLSRPAIVGTNDRHIDLDQQAAVQIIHQFHESVRPALQEGRISPDHPGTTVTVQLATITQDPAQHADQARIVQVVHAVGKKSRAEPKITDASLTATRLSGRGAPELRERQTPEISSEELIARWEPRPTAAASRNWDAMAAAGAGNHARSSMLGCQLDHPSRSQ